MFFLYKFSHSGAFQFDYVLYFFISKTGVSSPVLTIKILVVEIFGFY